MSFPKVVEDLWTQCIFIRGDVKISQFQNYFRKHDLMRLRNYIACSLNCDDRDYMCSTSSLESNCGRLWLLFWKWLRKAEWVTNAGSWAVLKW
jgi:hypothetical protein